MKYLVTVYQEDDPAMPYEEWAADKGELSKAVARISPMLRFGDTMIVTDENDNVLQERRKVAPAVRIVSMEDRLAEVRAQIEGAA